ncbi:MAG: recombinase family protein [Patescibacteria group bacterium]
MKNTDIPIKYCLYARKSSESDERQAMSIDSQIKEMTMVARRERINVIEVVKESHSAKATGQRPKFNYVLDNISTGKYNALISWAPDRLSRNAGDLGRIVDLMDQNRLVYIKTHSQTFSNNPNEKFLLMILCSQAKLENDNRGINVKRGLKSKCEMGIRPGRAPIGYINIMKANRIASVEIDDDYATIIKEMFRKVADEGLSGRMLRRWLDEIKFRTKNNCRMSLSRIYAILNNPFYYGEFRYGNKWHKGIHEPLVTKKLFDRVQIQLQVKPRQWNKQVFPFKKVCTCGGCGGSVTAEIKYRTLKSGRVNTHIYYHCNRVKDYDCKEPYITEEELIMQLISYINELKLDIKYLMTEFESEIKRLNHLKQVINDKKVENLELTAHKKREEKQKEYTENEMRMLREYLLHVLQFGSPEERLRILGGIKSRFSLIDRTLVVKN